jgi:hypothetical protein
MKFYEVNLDNCDGAFADVHVFEDGSHTVTRASNARKRFRHLLWTFRDDEAPSFVHDWLKAQLGHFYLS